MLRDYLSAKALHPSLKEGKRVKINLRGFGVINIFYSDFSIFYLDLTRPFQWALFQCCTHREFPTEMFQLGILPLIFFRDTDHFFQVVGGKSLVFSRQLNISQHFW